MSKKCNCKPECNPCGLFSSFPPTPLNTNIYNSDGALTGIRSVNLNNLSLGFLNGDSFFIGLDLPVPTPGQLPDFQQFLGANTVGLLLQQEFFRTNGPGVGIARSTENPTQVYYLGIAEGFLPGEPIYTGAGYINLPPNLFANIFRASSDFYQILSGNPTLTGYTESGITAVTVDSNNNVYGTQGSLTLNSQAIILSQTPITNNANTEFLTRNSATGAIELTTLPEPEEPLVAFASVQNLGGGGTLIAPASTILFDNIASPNLNATPAITGITVDLDGVYEISWSVVLETLGLQLVTVGVAVDGTLEPKTTNFTNVAGFANLSQTAQIPLTAGQVVSLVYPDTPFNTGNATLGILNFDNIVNANLNVLRIGDIIA
jgi:hypothetical protein